MATTDHAVWPCLYHRSQLSQGLQELDGKSVSEQAVFWRDLAQALSPDDRGARMPTNVNSDFLGRYFDSTQTGSNSSYEETAKILAEQDAPKEQNDGKLDLNGLLHLLGTHYGLAPLNAASAIKTRGNFIEEGTELPDFPRELHESEYTALEKLWNLVRSDGNCITKESFDYILRRLRIGWMVTHCKAEMDIHTFGEIFYYDYNTTKLSGSMNSREEGLKHWLWHSKGIFNPREQIAVGKPGSLFETTEEFLYDDPCTRGGDVHWIHLHQPSNALLVMIGQMYGLGVHCLSVLCRLGTTQQTNNFHSREWKIFTFPEVHMEKRARDSIKKYMAWKYDDAHEFKELPEICVETFTQNMCFVWHEKNEANDGTAHNDRNYHTFISATAKPDYLGHWSTKVCRSSFWQRPWQHCCSKRQKARGDILQHRAESTESERQPLITAAGRVGPTYSELANDSAKPADIAESALHSPFSHIFETPPNPDEDDPEAGKEKAEHDHRTMNGGKLLKAVDSKESHFNKVCGKVLSELGKDYSALRMGDHRQLVFRILLDRAIQYSDAVRLYSAAIHILQHNLKDPNVANKDLYIAKITHAKLQLQTLVGMVKPFAEGALKVLVKEGFEAAQKDKESFSSRLRRTNLIDIEHNLNAFLETAHAQIQLCDLSIAQYDREASDKGNSILYFLTIITFLVTPVQIVTGWYGMNFTHMPELKWAHGYHYCIFLCSALFFTFFALLRIVTVMT